MELSSHHMFFPSIAMMILQETGVLLSLNQSSAAILKICNSQRTQLRWIDSIGYICLEILVKVERDLIFLLSVFKMKCKKTPLNDKLKESFINLKIESTSVKVQ